MVPLELFFNSIEALGKRLGAVCWQLPGNFKFDAARRRGLPEAPAQGHPAGDRGALDDLRRPRLHRSAQGAQCGARDRRHRRLALCRPDRRFHLCAGCRARPARSATKPADLDAWATRFKALSEGKTDRRQDHRHTGRQTAAARRVRLFRLDRQTQRAGQCAGHPEAAQHYRCVRLIKRARAACLQPRNSLNPPSKLYGHDHDQHRPQLVRSPPPAARQDPCRVRFALGLATIAGAWGSQLIGGLVPCELCLEQRMAYYWGLPVLALVLIAVEPPAAAGVVRRGRHRRRDLRLVHLHGRLSRRRRMGLLARPDGLHRHRQRPQLRRSPAGTLKPVIPCDAVQFRFLGISLAGYNALISAAIVVMLLGAMLFQARRKA